MATITNARLRISRDRDRKTVTPEVTATVRFDTLERLVMDNTEEGAIFTLRCELWGDDGSFGDDRLYRFSQVIRFPDRTPSNSERATFTDTIGSSVLDEDDIIFNRGDEIYGRLILTSEISSFGRFTRNTNVVKGRF